MAVMSVSSTPESVCALNSVCVSASSICQDSECFLFKGHEMQRNAKDTVSKVMFKDHENSCTSGTKVPSLLDRLLSLVACFGIDL